MRGRFIQPPIRGAAAKDSAFPYPLAKVMANLNVDTVGRLERGKITAFGGETAREWGRTIEMSEEVKKKVDQIWQQLGI